MASANCFSARAPPTAGLRGRLALGASLAVVGGFVLVGLDHVIEAVLISAMPDWLTGFAASL